ncbi:hypothetical protein FRC01_007147 [Tulasnella sp. 417]|nr:hypothetical protein FRC01_007147 [Tulasnella sp. 417]
MADNEDINPYELLEIEPTATEAEIKKAYRQKSLKVHPDRHPNNPEAAQKFHELNTAYELLLDPTKRTALDTKLKSQQAKKLRFAAYDNKRKAMMEELEKSEREFKKSRLDAQREVDGAFAAVMGSGRKDHGLEGIEVSWAEGKEPDIVTWLKEKGHLVSGRENGAAAASGQDKPVSSNPSGSGGAFSSFPDDLSFDPEPIKPPLPTAAAAAASGLDFESLTFMRMRQAERERLEREILEAEAQEGA